MAGMSQDMLREYYFSAGQNYTAFKNKKDKTGSSPAATTTAADANVITTPAATIDSVPAAAAAAPAAAAATSVASDGVPAAGRESLPEAAQSDINAANPPSTAAAAATRSKAPAAEATATKPSKSAATPAGSAVSAAKKNNASGPALTSNSIDAASQEYILFLKQQQDLQKCHNKLEQILGAYEENRRVEQSELGKVRKTAQELLSHMEEGTGWNLKSKYNVDNIIKDAGLKLQTCHLYSKDAQPQYFELIQQHTNLQKLKQDHQEKEQFEPHKVCINNGLRRLERAEKELKNTQVDATALARVPDTLLVQLEHVFSTSTLKSLLQNDEETMEHLLFKLEQAKEEREAALEDGEMQLAEKHYYIIVDYYEELQATVLDKLSIVDKTQKETSVFDKVRETYQTKSLEAINTIKGEREKLKHKCEEDTQKLFALREKIEDVEKHMVLKMAEDCRKSDDAMASNTEKLASCWAKIEECEKELYQLERERHREVKKRVEDKEKDEQRRMEFEKFCGVCDEHTAHLDLTIRNCESLIHAANLVGEFVQSGFNTLGKDFSSKSKNHSETQLYLHKEHLSMFRGLFLALGELTHKKEKKIEDVDKQIQTSHINQELCADTLNPNAKKFSDVKKELLRVRDDLEQDVRELKLKAQDALTKFKVSEDALTDAEVEYIHPVVEHQEQALATRAKMVEYKAIAMGHVDTVPIRNEIEDVKRQLAANKQQVDMINSRTATSSAILPQINPKTQ